MRTSTARPTGALARERRSVPVRRRPCAPGRLTRPDLVERLRGVRGDLEDSLAAGEITQAQGTTFLHRIEHRLLEEQAGRA